MTVETTERVDRNTQAPPALELRSVSMAYGAVKALVDVSLTVAPGDVVGLLGDNGAGKSTLVKCISGLIRPDEGTILVRGIEADLHSPQAARDLGIEAVHQDLMLVGQMDVAANMFLNRETLSRFPPLRWLGWMDKASMARDTAATLDRLKIHIANVHQAVERLSGGQRQAIAVGRAVSWGRGVVLMDEPVAALGVVQSRVVLDLARELGDSGVSVIFITHNMQQVHEICNRAVVMRHGRVVGDVSTGDAGTRDLIDLITGASAAEESEVV
jgi:ABC-type sugar transport system ATPase subunit